MDNWNWIQFFITISGFIYILSIFSMAKVFETIRADKDWKKNHKFVRYTVSTLFIVFAPVIMLNYFIRTDLCKDRGNNKNGKKVKH